MGEQDRFAQLKERIDGLEASLQAEIARRVDADRDLRAHVDAQVSKVSERGDAHYQHLQRALQGGIEQVNRSISEVNAAISDEREQRKVDSDHVAGSLCARIEQVAAALEEDKVTRGEHDRQSLRKCTPLLP